MATPRYRFNKEMRQRLIDYFEPAEISGVSLVGRVTKETFLDGVPPTDPSLLDKCLNEPPEQEDSNYVTKRIISRLIKKCIKRNLIKFSKDEVETSDWPQLLKDYCEEVTPPPRKKSPSSRPSATKSYTQTKIEEWRADRKAIYGRKDDLDALNSFAADPKRNRYVLTAEAGMGKTTLLSAFIDQLEPTRFEVSYHFFSITKDVTSLESMYKNLAAQLGGTDAATAEDVVFAAAREDRSAQKTRIFVLDALDEASAEVQDKAHDIFSSLAANVKVVLSYRSDYRLRSQQNWLSDASPIPLPPLTKVGIAEWLTGLNVGSDSEEISTLAEQLHVASDGLPLLLRYLIEDVAERASASQPALPEGGALPIGLEKYVAQQWQELLSAQTDDLEPILRVMAFLAFAENEVPLADLLAVSKAKAVSAAGAGQWPTAFWRWWRRVGDPSAAKLAFAHPKLARAFAANQETWEHLRLVMPKALAFYGDPARRYDGYALMNRVRLMTKWLTHEAGPVGPERTVLLDELERTLTDFDYMNRRRLGEYRVEAAEAIRVMKDDEQIA